MAELESFTSSSEPSEESPPAPRAEGEADDPEIEENLSISTEPIPEAECNSASERLGIRGIVFGIIILLGLCVAWSSRRVSPRLEPKASEHYDGGTFVEERSFVTYTISDRKLDIRTLPDRFGLNLSWSTIRRLNPDLSLPRDPGGPVGLPLGTELRLYIQ